MESTPRETKTLKTPMEREIILKAMVTARERNSVRDLFYNNMKVDASGDKPEITEFSGSIVSKAEEKAIEATVVSYDGNTEDILNRILDATPEEYDFIIREINKIPGISFTKAK